MSDTGGAIPAGAGGLAPDRHPVADFFLCDIFDASPKDDLGTMEHPVFSLSTKPDRRILDYAHNGVSIKVTPSVLGRATIHDKDILIYCISQLMAAINAGREVSRTVRLRAHDFLVATNRDTGGDSYTRLRDAFERLAGTRITTNLAAGGTETTTGFGLIESWRIVRRTGSGRMVSVMVTLSDWLFRSVLAKSVLTLSRDYFRLRKPLERRVYEIARKHCGRQPEWHVSMTVLHKKSGSTAPLRVFRAAMRRMITAGTLPDYTMSEQDGDIVLFTRQGVVVEPGTGPLLSSDALDGARARLPGADVHALAAEWQAWWASTGRPRLTSPDRAFLAWLDTRARET
ncbi:plasmid replication initiator RepA [Salipiger aestuarii]|uniref:Plasmid replication initiation protein n=1 Tax=Salipiger aestuarii TaxID=568098 RepID=A0A327XM00_9RHOB|nr:replication initiator protein A [Salipiger aestuarii]KAB2536919.1 plasmid replication initiator RepA [Salipiger aestuarii]RAK09292.1 plasmid replication initiation protein [Salipiger aestuarii]